MSSSLISLENVHKKFSESSSSVHILRGVTLALKAGEVVGLIGESGAGKSTLLHLIGLLDEATSGRIMIQGKDSRHLSDTQRVQWRRDYIGFVYQKHHLLSEFTVLENVMMAQLVQGISQAMAKKNALAVLDQVLLSHRADYPILKLSGGEQQRASVARALVKNPKILLADEPTGNLDHETGEQVFSLFLRLAKQQKAATLIVTHNPSLTCHMDRVLILENGFIKEKK